MTEARSTGILPAAVEACTTGAGLVLRDLIEQNAVFNTQSYLDWIQAFRRNLHIPDCRESVIVRQLVRVAAQHRHEGIVQYLVGYGRRPGTDRVGHAIELGSGEALEFFISLDPLLPRRGRYHAETYMNVGLPLPEWKAMLAIETLLKHGANPNYPSSLMSEAISIGNPRLIALIDGYGGLPDKVDCVGAAAESGSIELVQYLLNCGADVDRPDPFSEGWTALHHAAKNGDLAMVEFLLAHGANPMAEGAEGEQPLDVADGAQKSEVRQRLAQALGAIEANHAPPVDVYLPHKAASTSSDAP